MIYRIEEKLSLEANGDFDRRRKTPANIGFMVAQYFCKRGLFFMAFFTVALLIMPLVLPPLPPPPLYLLLVPVAIMAALIFLAIARPPLPNVACNSM